MNNIKQAFLNNKSKLKKIEIKELDIDVYISKWSGKDRARMIPLAEKIESLQDETETETNKYEEMFTVMAKIVQETLKDENGDRVFDDSEEDFKLVDNFDGEIVQNLFEKIMSHNGMSEEAVKEAAKN